MAWERRKGRFYYYQKRRVDGCVRSIYLGRSEKAIEASRADSVAVPDEVLNDLGPAPVAQPHDESENLRKLDIASRAREGNQTIKWVRSDRASQASVIGRFHRAKPARFRRSGS